MVMLSWYYRWWNWKPKMLTAVASFTARKELWQNTKFILLESSKPKSHSLFISFYTALPSGILFCGMSLRSIHISTSQERTLILDPKLDGDPFQGVTLEKACCIFTEEFRTGGQEISDMKKANRRRPINISFRGKYCSSSIVILWFHY